MTARAANGVGAAVEDSPRDRTSQAPLLAQGECLSCRLIGSTALAAVGLYALNQSRRHQPGSLIGKRIVAGVGCCRLSFSTMVVISSYSLYLQASLLQATLDGTVLITCRSRNFG